MNDIFIGRMDNRFDVNIVDDKSLVVYDRETDTSYEHDFKLEFDTTWGLNNSDHARAQKLAEEFVDEEIYLQ